MRCKVFFCQNLERFAALDAGDCLFLDGFFGVNGINLSLIHISTIIDEFELGTIDRSTTLYKKAGSNSPFTIG